MRKPKLLNRAQRRRRDRKGRTGRKQGILAALSAAALALPGMAPEVEAASPIEDYKAAYAHYYYVEDPIDPGDSDGGERQRYEIFTHQLQLTVPIGERVEVGSELIHETMSGASPWFVQPNTQNKPVQAMSGATIDEERTDLLLSASYFFDRTKWTLAGGTSVENDYLSGNFGFGFEREMMDKNTTLNMFYSFSTDQIEPTDGGSPLFPDRIRSAEKESHSLSLGLSQILTRSTIASFNLDYKQSKGFLSDPYKLVFVVSANQADSRPGERNQLTLQARLRQHIAKLDGSLHADYGFYIDDWDVSSHTFELAWFHELFDIVSLSPSVRYYSQSQASFYQPFFRSLRDDGFYTSDYRLSPYGAIRYGLEANVKLSDLPFFFNRRMAAVIQLSYDRYLSDASFALSKVAVENPGLVSYHLFSGNVAFEF